MIWILHHRSPGTTNAYSMWYQAQAIAKVLQSFDDVNIAYYYQYRPLRDAKVIIVEDFFVYCKFNLHKRLRNKTIAWLDSAVYESNVKFPQSDNIGLVVTSEYDKKRFEKYTDNIIAAVPRCFDVISLNASVTLYPQVDKIFDFITIGWKDMFDRKNFNLLFELAKEFPDLKFCVITNDSRFDQLPNVTRYRFGEVNDVEKYTLLRSSKFYLHLSKFEGFGVPVIEALACGTPVIMSDALIHNTLFNCKAIIKVPCKQHEFASSSLGKYLFFYVDVPELFEIIKYAKEISPTEYADMSREAIEFAQKFDSYKVAIQLYNLLNSF